MKKKRVRHRITVKESAIRREMREHPWASRKVAMQIARDHAKKKNAG